jgi:CelD/BcsL family acetyltransferase involved in cellulose biosynthesis
VVVAGNPESPDAMLPLVRRRGQPWFSETLGVRDLFEATDVFGCDEAALRALAEALAARGLPLRLRRLRADSPLLPHLREVYARRAKLVTRSVPGVPTIALNDAWRHPTTQFSRRRGQSFRAARRRLDALGSVELSVEQPISTAETNRLLEEFMVVEAAGWKSRAGSALASNPRMQQFFRTYCRHATETGELRFAMLRLDGRAVAGQLATESAHRFSLFKIGYDESYSRSSPGNLLMLHSVQYAAKRGLDSFEFLGSEEPWTRFWTKSVRECVEVHVYPTRPWTPLAAGAIALQLASRQLRRRHESRAGSSRPTASASESM